ncbi:MAG TPA: YncE family protein [Verrucomicrobiae bacterium]|jgi:DNA-binding beta-propeller fold protein YncE|nr:YncE family protein [Verrucomicrobiae bacterium]
MKHALCSVSGLLTIAAAGLLAPLNSGAQLAYHFIKSIPITDEGGWDYLSIDPQAHRLYMSHGTEVVVIDTSSDTVVGHISDTPGVHGLAPAPDLGKGFVSCGKANECHVVDLKTLQTIAKLPTGQNPDGMLFEPGKQEAYMFNGRGKSATVIDAKENEVVATIPLDGKPEFATADPAAGRVYDNLEDKSEVAVIDTATHKVVNNWPIAPGESASGMAIDTAHHRLFLGCDNNMMVMMDSSTGKVITSVPIGEGVDACAFDPVTQLAFSSCRDGTTTIAHEDSPEKLTVVQTLKTEPSARTMTIDPKTHRIYLPAAKFGPRVEGQRRPPMIPGSLHLLVYGNMEAAPDFNDSGAARERNPTR